MSFRAKLPRLVLAVALSAAVVPAFAGRQCLVESPNPVEVRREVAAAANLERWLTAEQPDVAIIARRGQNLDKYGVTFSHVGYAVRRRDGSGWDMVHDLNKCGTAEASLFRQGLFQFFEDGLASMSVAVIIPTPEVQQQLRTVLDDSQRRYAMQEPHYSAVANPFMLKYQNSDGWVLETYVLATHPEAAESRAAVQQYLQSAGYAPSLLSIGWLKRAAGPLFMVNVEMDDHIADLQQSGKVAVSTGDSVLRFLGKEALLQPQCDHGAFPASVCLVAEPLEESAAATQE